MNRVHAAGERSAGIIARSCAGFTYLIALFAVAIAGAMLAGGSVVWHQDAQRAREQELLRVGNEFRRAIGVFYERTTGGVKRYPERLEDLLRDPRDLTVQRYLRRIYRDPLTGEADWGLVPAPGGGVMGVYSRSDLVPVKVAGFDETEKAFTSAQKYSDWKFVYVPPVIPVQPKSPPSNAKGAPPPQ